jgi:hypothetical protein
LYANAEQALAAAGLEAELVKVEDFAEIARRGVMMTPALVVDGEVKVSGQVARPEQIVEWLRNQSHDGVAQ